MINCKLLDSTLTFEYCENIDADIVDEIVSIINPTNGVIKCKDYKELIINENNRDYNKSIKVIKNNKYEI